MISKQEIQKIAELSRLRLQPEELDLIATQLSSVLGHFQEIAKLDTTGVEPMVTPSEVAPYLREDEVEHRQLTDKLLGQAPARSGNLFKVPPVVG